MFVIFKLILNLSIHFIQLQTEMVPQLMPVYFANVCITFKLLNKLCDKNLAIYIIVTKIVLNSFIFPGETTRESPMPMPQMQLQHLRNVRNL